MFNDALIKNNFCFGTYFGQFTNVVSKWNQWSCGHAIKHAGQNYI